MTQPPSSPLPSGSPPERPSLAEVLSGQVLDYVRAAGLGPGDRLPSMVALAQRFAVATPTLREALRRLEATGMVEIRHGSGCFLRGSPDHAVVVNPHYGQISSERISDLLRARLLIEPPLAALAAQHATPPQRAELRALLGEAARHLGGQDRELQRVNAAFHVGLARCSGNAVLHSVVDSLMQINTSEQFTILKLYDAREQDHAEHLELLLAVEKRQARQARRLMQRHLETVLRVVERRLAAPGGDAAT
ncbi:FadR/GntR family transcriptional regulator [Deinococcus sp.]|uniref:FadR/GntR family transcriptional regulator n=1 Tax=Deinococcus sp. TaxID=47478 RepID=UPI003CC67C83